MSAKVKVKVYLATSSGDVEIAEKWIAKLREIGCEITLDWTVENENHCRQLPLR